MLSSTVRRRRRRRPDHPDRHRWVSAYVRDRGRKVKTMSWRFATGICVLAMVPFWVTLVLTGSNFIACVAMGLVLGIGVGPLRLAIDRCWRPPPADETPPR